MSLGGGCLASRTEFPLKTSSTLAVFAIPNVGFAVFLLSFAVFAVFAGFEGLDLHELSILGVCLAGKTELLLGPVLAFCCFYYFSYLFCWFFVEFCCICCFCLFWVAPGAARS